MTSVDRMTAASHEVTGPIIAGVDNSRAARHALEWAASEAEARGTRVIAIRVFEHPLVALAGPYPRVDPLLTHELAEEARTALRGFVDEVSKGYPTVQIEAKVFQGPAADVLVGASEGAYALAVGSRGHSAVASLLLGSVSQRCVARAHCPVVVVGPHAQIETHEAQTARHTADVNWSPP